MAEKKGKKEVVKKGRRPTYAKGKKASGTSKKKKSVAPAKKPAAKERTREAAAGKEGKAPLLGSFNLIRKGTLEMKVFLALMVLVVLGTAAIFPSLLESIDYERKEDEKTSQTYVHAKEIETSRALRSAPQDPGTAPEEVPAEDKTEEKDKNDKEKKKEPSSFTMFLIFMFQYLFFWTILTFLGLNISRKAGLSTPILDRWARGEPFFAQVVDALKVVLPIAVVTAGVVFGSHTLFNSLGHITETGFKPSFGAQILSAFASGTLYEILPRLFIMSALVWMLSRWNKKGIWIAIVAASFIMAAPNFFSNDIQKILAVRELVSISILGLVSGYLYYKRGFEHSMILSTAAAMVFSVLSLFI